MNGTPKAEGKSTTGRRLLLWAVAAAAVLVIVYFGGRTLLIDRNGPVRLIVYAFSTQEELLTQEIFPAFETSWEAETGRDLHLEGIFGPSATLAGQINLGAPADVAIFSNEQDVTRIKVGGRIDRNAHSVIVSYTPMVIANAARQSSRPGAMERPGPARAAFVAPRSAQFRRRRVGRACRIR